LKTLALTSPLTSGAHVRAVQRTLQTGGILHTDFLRSAVDGAFGPATGRACVRAKYRLGYPEKDLQPTYGDKLNSLLTGAKPLPQTYKLRAAARAKQAATKPPMRLQALAYLSAHIGETEKPAGSNRIPWASDWYGIAGPWCAMAVTRAYFEAGSKVFVRGSRYAYCPFIYEDAKYGRNGLALTTDPQPGDVVLYDWDGAGVSDHVGLFAEWVDKSDGIFRAIEGNTSADDKGSQSNGGMVARRARSSRLVQAFVRVGR
jgi:hypothetical protein